MKRLSRTRKHSVLTAILETLEQRRLLAGVSLNGDTLIIDGTEGADTILVSRLVQNNQASLIASLNGQTTSFAESQVAHIQVNGNEGDDAITIAPDVTAPASLLGGQGNDSLTGGGGNDLLAGNDGSDTVNGGGGLNTHDLTDRVVDLSIGTAAAIGGGETDNHSFIQRILSGAGNDTIKIYAGNSGTNAILYVDGGAGNDAIEYYGNSLAAEPTVRGGAGNDSIFMQTQHRISHYFGDAGDDVFTVQRSDGTSHDFHGGDGIDTVDFRRYTGGGWAVYVTLDDVADDGAPTGRGSLYRAPGPDNVHSDIEKIIGTDGNDTLIGSNKNETLIGASGQDSIDGGEGDDWIEGNRASGVVNPLFPGDKLIGGPGHDTIISSNNYDTIVSDADDTVIGSLQMLPGTSGNDVIQMVLNNDGSIDTIVNGAVIKNYEPGTLVGINILCGDGNDEVTIDPAIALSYGVTINGQAGDDTIHGGGGADSIYGGDGNDVLFGGSSGGYVAGEAGNDVLTAGAIGTQLSDGADDDTVTGGAGDDSFEVGLGRNLLDGKGGRDLLDFRRILTGSISGGNGSFTTPNGVVTYTDFESLNGTEGGDNIAINASLDSIRRIESAGGNDVITYTDSRATSPEETTLIGPGLGTDSVVVKSTPKVTINLSDGGDIDTVTGDLGNDSIISDAADVIIDTSVAVNPPAAQINGHVLYVNGTDGNDQVFLVNPESNLGVVEVNVNGAVSTFPIGQFDLIQISTGIGHDLVRFDQFRPFVVNTKIYTGSGNDSVFGCGGSDRVYAGDGNDWVGGFGGNDVIYGEVGNDRLFGGDGKDYIVGGEGVDVLRGEGGQDRIIANAGEDDYKGNSGDLFTLLFE